MARRRFIMFAFGFQASSFRERGAESFGLHGFQSFRGRRAGTEAESGTEEGEVRADAASEVQRMGRRR